MAAVKVGLIGYGRIAELVHLKVLLDLSNVELVALAESDSTRREEVRKRAPGAVVFADYKKLLDIPDVEAVVICLPPALHAECALAALQAGKHVYLEKPIATNLADARKVVEAWRSAGTAGMIGFNYRFNTLYHTVKRHVESGRLGELVSARSVFSSSVRTLPTWKQTRRNGGGVLLDLASHHVDLMHFLFGEEINEVFARVWSYQTEDDSAMLELRLMSGLLVQSFFSMSSVDEDRFEIYGASGKLAVDRYLSLDAEVTDPVLDFSRLKQLGRGLRALVRSPYVLGKIVAPSREPSYRSALSHFVTAVQTDQTVRPDFWDGYRNLAVIEAAEESARTRRVVSTADFAKEGFTHQ